ncbi:MAG: hypothetical protein HOP12_08640 [Candidatus Eisenbacteria bacterium]|uniref:HEAT repeat domain-containing protein n=1 Tax=Eiseniibacteriota bacterium TaxID=2212470 RepID=A0A849SS69_UNCEI|nr:hypothetical protein [Candidatus Eisenbacteria bacterium]
MATVDPPIPGLSLPPLLALAVVLVVMAVGFYLVRAMQRRSVGRTRGRAHELRRALSAHLAGRLDAARLRSLAASATEDEFWAALEHLSMNWQRGDRSRLSRALRGEEFSADERRALRNDSPWRQVLAVRRLSLLRSRLTRRALRRALIRGPEVVTQACATTLAFDRDLAVLRWLLSHPQALARRTHRVRVELLRSFGRGAAPVLLAVLEEGMRDLRLELAVIDALGLLRSGRARVEIERRLRGREMELRVVAARALGRIGREESGGALLAALSDEAWQVRAQVAKALGAARVDHAVHALPARLSDPSWWVRRHSAYALARLGEPGRLALNTIVNNSSDGFARDIAREVLDGGFPLDRAS